MSKEVLFEYQCFLITHLKGALMRVAKFVDRCANALSIEDLTARSEISVGAETTTVSKYSG